MAGNTRTKYETQVYLNHNRRIMEESIDAGDYFPNLDFYDYITPIQQMIFFFLLKGFTLDWIQEHMEYDSRQALNYHVITIRRKLRQYLEDTKDEE